MTQLKVDPAKNGIKLKIRCELHLGQKIKKVFLVPRPEEKMSHLALKLAGLVMFHDFNPIVEPSPDHPSLYGFAHRPDLCVLDDGGQITHWIECGNVSLHKLDKVLRKMPQGLVIVIKDSKHEAEKLRKDLSKEVKNSGRVSIWTWEKGEFETWLDTLDSKTEVFGEAHERFINVVINEVPYVAQLIQI